MLKWICECIANWILAAAIRYFSVLPAPAVTPLRGIFCRPWRKYYSQYSHLKSFKFSQTFYFVSDILVLWFLTSNCNVTVRYFREPFYIFNRGLLAPNIDIYVTSSPQFRTLLSGSNQYLTVGSRGPPTADPSPARVIGHRHRRRMTAMPQERLSVTHRCDICVFTDVDLTYQRNTDYSLISSGLTMVEILRRTLCSSNFSLCIIKINWYIVFKKPNKPR